MNLSHRPRAMTVDQAAAFLRLSTDDVVEAMNCGELAVIRVDGTDLVDTDQLLSDLGVDGQLVRQANSYGQRPRAEG